MIRTYKVEFDTYQNRVAIEWFINVKANNKTEAKAVANDLWQEKHYGKKKCPHQFHIMVSRIQDCETDNIFHAVNSSYYNWGYHG